MLKNFEDIVPKMVIEDLNSSQFEFFLTGSRAWGLSRKNSDWDFFVEDSQEVRSFLENLRFRLISSSYIEDQSSVAVYEYIHDGTIIQIQLVKSGHEKIIVQDALMKMFPQGFSDKNEAKKMWRIGFELLNTGKGLVSP